LRRITCTVGPWLCDERHVVAAFMSYRTQPWQLLMAAGSVLLSACTLPVVSSSASLPAEPQAQIVSVEGRSYLITPLTASTWTVTPKGVDRPIDNSASGKAALIQAIEKTSGCKVTDSDLSRQGLQLDAQVDCGARLKN
jgi:hypothetical protein